VIGPSISTEGMIVAEVLMSSSQAQAAELQDVIENLQELIPEEPEEDLEEVESSSSVKDN
jgi:hypothetical protein